MHVYTRRRQSRALELFVYLRRRLLRRSQAARTTRSHFLQSGFVSAHDGHGRISKLLTMMLRT